MCMWGDFLCMYVGWLSVCVCGGLSVRVCGGAFCACMMGAFVSILLKRLYAEVASLGVWELKDL